VHRRLRDWGLCTTVSNFFKHYLMVTANQVSYVARKVDLTERGGGEGAWSEAAVRHTELDLKIKHSRKAD
jgi:hypothetical protein